MKKDFVSKLRHFQMVFSLVLFALVTALCWVVTGFDITKIEISAWGGASKIWWIWNGCLMLLSITILFNVIIHIRRHRKMKYKGLFYFLFAVTSISLFLIGLFPVQYGKLHAAAAYVYFFAYPLAIFGMAFLNRRALAYEEWVKHTMLSIIMITVPVIFIQMFEGKAVAEILHSVVVGIWNISLLGHKHGVKKEGKVAS